MNLKHKKSGKRKNHAKVHHNQAASNKWLAGKILKAARGKDQIILMED